MAAAPAGGRFGPAEAGAGDRPSPVSARPRAPGRWQAWSRGWRLVLVVGVVTVLVRWPGLHDPAVFNNDEAFVAAQAQVLNRGGDLYTQAIDRKPPVVPVLTAAVFRVTGRDDLRPVRAAAAGAVVGAAVLLAGVARRRAGDDPRGPAADLAALAAALFLVVVTVALPAGDGQSFTFEAFALPTMVGAVFLADRHRFGWAGVALAVAALTKQTALVAVAPVAWSAWRHGRPPGPSLVRLLSGMVVPVMAAAAAFGWGPFWFWVAAGNGGYLEPLNLDVQLATGADRIGRWLAAVAPVVGLSGLAVVAAARGGRPAGGVVGPVRPRLFTAGLWMVATVPAVCAGWRFFPHYLIQAAPPLALLGALGLAAAVRPVRLAAVTAAVALAAWSVVQADQPPRHRATAPVVAAIERFSRPGEPIFVWGMYPQAYWASDRPPATRFLNVGFLTNVSGGVVDRDQVGEAHAVSGTWDELDADLRATPPALVVDTTRGTAIDVRAFPRIRLWLETSYHEVAHVATADIWVRNDRP